MLLQVCNVRLKVPGKLLLPGLYQFVLARLVMNERHEESVVGKLTLESAGRLLSGVQRQRIHCRDDAADHGLLESLFRRDGLIAYRSIQAVQILSYSVHMINEGNVIAIRMNELQVFRAVGSEFILEIQFRTTVADE